MTRSTPGRWTPAEDATLKRMLTEGTKPCAIAKQLRRPESSVYRRMETLQRPARRERNCMCCGNTFMSDGPHNRLCGRCRTTTLSPFDI